MLSLVQTLCVWILPVLLAITLHEAAHAFVAYRFGDSTSKMMGRLTLNPIKHIDLIGTIAVPILVGLLSQFNFIFGWAKPVPINYNQLGNPRRDMALVALAGPFSNIIMAFLWAILLKIGIMLDPRSSIIALFLVLTGQAGIFINLILAFLNLIPVPPLDGSRVVSGLLRPDLAATYNRIEPYGLIIILVMLATNILSMLITPPMIWSLRFIHTLFGIH